MPDNVLLIDAKPFVERTKELGANTDQLPFVLMQLLNDAAFAARRVIVESTWPSHVQVRNKSFISASLRVDKATKDNLSIRLYDVLGRGHLLAHARGGTVRPFKARLFAIPVNSRIKRTTMGVSARDKPRAIMARTPKNALRVTPRGIFVAKGGKLEMMYALKPSVSISRSVPFFEDFAFAVANDMRTSFDTKMAAAMATRRA
jgi:hypothetical protein